MRALPTPSLGLSGNARVLFFMICLSELGFGLYYQNLLTVYMEALGSTPAQIGAILTATGVIRILLMLPAGTLGDRMPRRTVAIGASFLAIPGALTYAAAQNWWHLALAGLLMACNQLGFPAISGIIADSVENPEARLEAFRKIYTIAPAVAFIVGPTTSGWIADLVSPRAVFLLAAIVFSGAWLLVFRVREPISQQRGDGRGTYRDVVAEPALRSVLGLKLAVIATLTLGTTLMPNLLKESYGLDQRTLGYLFSIAAVGSFLLSTLIGRLGALNHIRGIALAVSAVGLVCLVTLLTGNQLALAVAFLFRGGFLIAWSLFTPLLSDIAPKRVQERAFASGEFVGSAGNTVAPIFAGSLYEVDRRLPFGIAAVLLGLLGLVALVFDRRVVRPAAAREAAERQRAAATEAETAREQLEGAPPYAEAVA